MKSYFSVSTVSRIIASVLLFWALARHPYGYFTLLRWITCAVAAYCAYLSYSLNRIPCVPFVYGALYTITFLIPLLLIPIKFKLHETPSTSRLVIAALATPFIFIVFRLLFFLLLPIASWTTGWLDPDDVIRATNGPTLTFYKIYYRPFQKQMDVPQIPPQFAKKSSAQLRTHVAKTYLSDDEYAIYFKNQFNE